MNDKNKLRDSASFHETVGGWFGFIVAIGISVEMWFAENWHTLIADLLIGVGVCGEVLFAKIAIRKSHELSAILEDEAASSNRIAEEARLETAKLRYKMLGRGVEPEQAKKIAELAPSFTWPRESAISIYFIPGDAESNRFAIQLRWALEDAGITTGISSHTSSLSEPIYGLNVCGQEGPHGEHARQLSDILTAAGFEVGGAHSDELPSILVGVNPPPT